VVAFIAHSAWVGDVWLWVIWDSDYGCDWRRWCVTGLRYTSSILSRHANRNCSIVPIQSSNWTIRSQGSPFPSPECSPEECLLPCDAGTSDSMDYIRWMVHSMLLGGRWHKSIWVAPAGALFIQQDRSAIAALTACQATERIAPKCVRGLHES